MPQPLLRGWARKGRWGSFQRVRECSREGAFSLPPLRCMVALLGICAHAYLHNNCTYHRFKVLLQLLEESERGDGSQISGSGTYPITETMMHITIYLFLSRAREDVSRDTAVKCRNSADYRTCRGYGTPVRKKRTSLKRGGFAHRQAWGGRGYNLYTYRTGCDSSHPTMTYRY